MAYIFKHGDRPLEGFTIQRGIGRGGFGEVYYAISDGGREVALKYLRDNAEIELRGVTHCMNLKSPHLVSIFDVKKNDDGDYFIVMEHISGPSLGELMSAEPNGLGVEKAAYFLREIAKGLAYLHDRGIVHRDMKPANIFYEDGHVKIGDYGLSKFISVSRHSAQTTSIGTVHYMAPEVGSGNYHRGIDIYALGVMLYEMLLGRVPFEGSSMGEVLMKHLTEQPEVEGLPEPFGKVIRKALEKDPKDRYQSVNEMMDDLLEVGDVRNSLAGFNPNTITSMRGRAMADTLPTPVPSPNPPRYAPAPGGRVRIRDGVPVAVNVPRQMDKRIRRVSDKVSRKMDALAGRPHRRRGRGWGGGDRAGGRMSANDMRTPQRVVLAVLGTLGISVAAVMATNAMTGDTEVGACAGIMVYGLVAGLFASMKVLDWLGSETQPKWVESFVILGCCALPMTVACLPLVDIHGGGAFGLLAAMAVMLTFADIEGRVERGARGEFSFGSAFRLGLWGFACSAVAASIFEVSPEENFLAIGAATGAALSLNLQALGWLIPGRWINARAPSPQTEQTGAVASDQRFSEPSANVAGDFTEPPHAIPVQAGTPVSGYASTAPQPDERSSLSRGFWSLVGFVMLAAMVIANFFAALVVHPDDELLAIIVGAVACGAMMIFAFQKVTLRKRPGFWQETLCPFLIAVDMTAFGACVSLLAVMRLREPELWVTICGVVFSGLALGFLLASRFGVLRWLVARGDSGSDPFVMGIAIGGGHDGTPVEVVVEADAADS